jgi:integrase
MPHLYLDKRCKPPVWRYQIWDYNRKRKSLTGTTSKRETLELAQRRQAFENEIRDGIRPRPKPSDAEREIEPFIIEYLAWGASQGGHHGRPWAVKTLEKKKFHLKFWREKLNLKTLQDLHGVLPRVEKVLREVQQDETPAKGFVKNSGGRAGKTLLNYADGIRSFTHWLYLREYIDFEPLRRLGRFDSTPKTTRRALTADEIHKLLHAMEGTKYGERRRLGYEVALASGLRANELRSLRVKDLDTERGGLNLDPAWTKNHKTNEDFQPLPRFLVEKLKRISEGKNSHDPMLFVAREAASALEADLERAGLTKWGPGGKVDFHALRVAYVTHVVESGADIKTAQTLARHCSPQLTLGIYAKARPERMRNTVEAIGHIISDLLSKSSTA